MSQPLHHTIKHLYTSIQHKSHLRTALSHAASPHLVLFAFGLFASAASAHCNKPSLALLAMLFSSALAVSTVKRTISPSPFPAHIIAPFNDDTAPSPPTRNDSDVSKHELLLLNFIESITVGHSGPHNAHKRRSGVWAMDGGGKQLGFTARRYHLAFAGYAAAITCAKTPAYVGKVRGILAAAIEHMLEEDVWAPLMDEYWPHIADPFRCDENIMWTGHLLQLCVHYEAQTGCQRFRKELVAVRSLGTSVKVAYKSSVDDLARRIVCVMQQSPTGGVACEPGRVFFQCNNHPQIALRMLERLRSRSFSSVRQRWERFALTSLCAATGGALKGTGAFRIMAMAVHAVTVPFGHLGSDGWSLTHYFAWAKSAETVRRVWFDITRPVCHGLFRATALSGAVQSVCSDAPDACCYNMNIPVSAWACSLLPVCAQAGDGETFEMIARWVREKYWRQNNDADDGGMLTAWCEEGVEWMVGNTAQFLMGVALRSSPGLYRNLVLSPLPREYFKSPVVESVQWVAARGGGLQHADVFRCSRTDTCVDGVMVSVLRVGVFLPVGVMQCTGVQVVLANAGRVVDVMVSSKPTESVDVFHDTDTGMQVLVIPCEMARSGCGGEGKVCVRIEAVSLLQ